MANREIREVEIIDEVNSDDGAGRPWRYGLRVQRISDPEVITVETIPNCWGNGARLPE